MLNTAIFHLGQQWKQDAVVTVVSTAFPAEEIHTTKNTQVYIICTLSNTEVSLHMELYDDDPKNVLS